MVLYVCCILSQTKCFEFAKIFLKVEIETILYTLRQEREIHADKLAQTFRSEDVDVIKRPTKINVLYALGQCVPQVPNNDLTKILSCFSEVCDRDKIPIHCEQCVSEIKQRYKLVGSERFLYKLRELLWKYMMYPQPLPLDSKSDADASVWLTGEATQQHYITLQSNLAQYQIIREDSIMLQVCCALLESNYVLDSNIWVKTDIETILYLLCQESEKMLSN